MSRKSYRVKFPGGDRETQLAGIVDRPDDASPGGPVVVFSHCFTCNKDLKSTVRIARAMCDRGIAVLRFDMTGLGNSEGDFSRSSFSTNLADLSAAIDFAGSDLGPVTGLMGHSFGGAASLATAAKMGTSIDAVVTLAAPSDTVHLADLLSKMQPAIQSDGAGTVTIGGMKWQIRREMLDDFRSHDLPKLITQITSPVLLLHSPTDKTVVFDHALRIMSTLQLSPHEAPVSLLSLQQADHLLSDPSDIDFVSDTAAAFFHRYRR